MLAFLIILLALVTVNILLLLLSMNSIDKNTDNVPGSYLFNKKKREHEAVPFYGVYKKAI